MGSTSGHEEGGGGALRVFWAWLEGATGNMALALRGLVEQVLSWTPVGGLSGQGLSIVMDTLNTLLIGWLVFVVLILIIGSFFYFKFVIKLENEKLAKAARDGEPEGEESDEGVVLGGPSRPGGGGGVVRARGVASKAAVEVARKPTIVPDGPREPVPPPVATGADPDAVNWANNIFTWFYNSVEGSPIITKNWLETVCENTVKTALETGILVEVVEVYKCTPAPLLSNMVVDCSPTDNVTITCDCDATIYIRIITTRTQGELTTESEYACAIRPLRGRLNIAAITDKLMTVVKFDGWPEVSLELEGIRNNATGLHEQSIKDVISEVVASAVRNSVLDMNLQNVSTFPRFRRARQAPDKIIPVGYDSMVRELQTHPPSAPKKQSTLHHDEEIEEAGESFTAISFAPSLSRQGVLTTSEEQLIIRNLTKYPSLENTEIEAEDVNEWQKSWEKNYVPAAEVPTEEEISTTVEKALEEKKEDPQTTSFVLVASNRSKLIDEPRPELTIEEIIADEELEPELKPVVISAEDEPCLRRTTGGTVRDSILGMPVVELPRKLEEEDDEEIDVPLRLEELEFPDKSLTGTSGVGPLPALPGLPKGPFVSGACSVGVEVSITAEVSSELKASVQTASFKPSVAFDLSECDQEVSVPSQTFSQSQSNNQSAPDDPSLCSFSDAANSPDDFHKSPNPSYASPSSLMPESSYASALHAIESDRSRENKLSVSSVTCSILRVGEGGEVLQDVVTPGCTFKTDAGPSTLELFKTSPTPQMNSDADSKERNLQSTDMNATCRTVCSDDQTISYSKIDELKFIDDSESDGEFVGKPSLDINVPEESDRPEFQKPWCLNEFTDSLFKHLELDESEFSLPEENIENLSWQIVEVYETDDKSLVFTEDAEYDAEESTSDLDCETRCSTTDNESENERKHRTTVDEAENETGHGVSDYESDNETRDVTSDTKAKKEMRSQLIDNDSDGDSVNTVTDSESELSEEETKKEVSNDEAESDASDEIIEAAFSDMPEVNGTLVISQDTNGEANILDNTALPVNACLYTESQHIEGELSFEGELKVFRVKGDTVHEQCQHAMSEFIKSDTSDCEDEGEYSDGSHDDHLAKLSELSDSLADTDDDDDDEEVRLVNNNSLHYKNVVVSDASVSGRGSHSVELPTKASPSHSTWLEISSTTGTEKIAELKEYDSSKGIRNKEKIDFGEIDTLIKKVKETNLDAVVIEDMFPVSGEGTVEQQSEDHITVMPHYHSDPSFYSYDNFSNEEYNFPNKKSDFLMDMLSAENTAPNPHTFFGHQKTDNSNLNSKHLQLHYLDSAKTEGDSTRFHDNAADSSSSGSEVDEIEGSLHEEQDILLPLSDEVNNILVDLKWRQTDIEKIAEVEAVEPSGRLASGIELIGLEHNVTENDSIVLQNGDHRPHNSPEVDKIYNPRTTVLSEKYTSSSTEPKSSSEEAEYLSNAESVFSSEDISGGLSDHDKEVFPSAKESECTAEVTNNVLEFSGSNVLAPEICMGNVDALTQLDTNCALTQQHQGSSPYTWNQSNTRDNSASESSSLTSNWPQWNRPQLSFPVYGTYFVVTASSSATPGQSMGIPGLNGKRLLVKIVKAVGIGCEKSVAEAYAVVEMDEPPQKFTTAVVKDTSSPFWDEQFLFDLSDGTLELLFELYDKKDGNFLGLGIVGIEELVATPSQRQIIPLQTRPYEDDEVSGSLTVEFLFLDRADLPDLTLRSSATTQSLSSKGDLVTTTTTTYVKAPESKDVIVNGGDGVAAAVLRDIEEKKVVVANNANKSTMIIHASRKPGEEDEFHDMPVEDLTALTTTATTTTTTITTAGAQNIAATNSLKMSSSNTTTSTATATSTTNAEPVESTDLDERGRSRGSRRKRDSFFGTLKKRFSRSKARSKSVDPGARDVSLDRDQSVGRSVSMERTANVRASGLLSVPASAGGDGGSTRSSISDTSAISSSSTRTYVNEASTLIVETSENGILKHFLIPLSLQQKSKWRKKGLKLHVFGEHTFIAKHMSSTTPCQVCQKNLGRRFGKQGYECRDCGFKCHKPCHVKTDTVCPNSTVNNMDLLICMEHEYGM